MNWYAALTENLLEPENINDRYPLEKARLELKNRIVSLYEALLLYQIKRTCCYYRNQLWLFLSRFLDIDDWSGNLQALTDAEDAVRKDSEQYNKQHMKFVFDRILITEKAQIALKQEMERDEEDRNCLRDLHWIDPRDELQDIKARKDDLIDDSYKWILDTNEFKNFSDWKDPEASSLLWITGQAGMGKTMLLIGIIQELTKERLTNPEAPSISYFFCQGSTSEFNGALGVLRSLLWLLLVQQPRLISHVREAYKIAGKKTFAGAVAFEKLSGILKSALEDKELEPLILVIDALDECDQGDRPSLIRFLSTVLSSTKTNSKVKWIILTHPLPEIEMDMNGAGRYLKSMLSLDDRNLEVPIGAFISHKIQQLRDKGHEEDTLKLVSDRLRERSGNTFLWVWLVCK
jgi:N-terminal domain of NWD NACHT-NTPase/NACHT domain